MFNTCQSHKIQDGRMTVTLVLLCLQFFHLMIVLLIHMAAAADMVRLVIGALNMEPSGNKR